MAKAGVDVHFVDKGLKQLFDNLKELGKLRITVGYQGRETTETLEPGGPTTSAVARFNEFGTRSIPARPFMRSAVKEAGQAIADVAAIEFGQVAENDADPVDAMAEVAKVMQDAVLKKLDTTRSWAKANRPSTIAKKGSMFPPLDAGNQRLHDGLSWAVREGRTVVEEGQ